MMKMQIEGLVDELITLRDVMRWAVTQFNSADLFYGHGTDNAWDEAVALIMPSLNLPPDTDRSILDARLIRQERQEILLLIQRRITERLPAPYLTHKAWFAGLPFYVDTRVLIPRSPIAEVIESGFQPWLGEIDVTRILDIGTGSGCLAIASALAFPIAQVDAVDISPEALEVAMINVKKHHLEERVRLIQSDVFVNLPGEIYDIIVSNPPYVGTEEMQQLPQEYRHEPELGLIAGTTGLDIVVRILAQAKEHLSPHGLLIVEVGNSEDILRERFPFVPFTWLEFERGGGGVFLLTAAQVTDYHKQFIDFQS